MPLTLVFLLQIVVLGLAIFTLSTTSSRVADRASQKAQATALAEAGINALYTKIAIQATAGGSPPNWPTSLSSVSLSSTIGSVTRTDGTYSAQVTNAPTASTSGSITTYTFVIRGTGTAPNGITQSNVTAVCTASNGSYGSYGWGNHALESNYNITLSGGASTSDPSGNHHADAWANGVVTVSGSTSSVDGVIDVPAASYATTVSKSPGQTVQTVSPISFPSASTITSWQSSWQSQSKESFTGYSSGHTLTSYTQSGGTATLTVPCYISGNLTVSGGGVLTIQPDTSASPPYVLYVGGTLTISGGSSLTNNGALIVGVGKIDLSGGSTVAGYTVTDTSSSALVGLSTDNNNAIVISGGTSANTIGFVYATSGGITMSGGSTITGSAIAGGSSGTITFSGGSTLSSPGTLNNIKIFPGQGYTTSKLSQWN